jgi:hypothetical protein
MRDANVGEPCGNCLSGLRCVDGKCQVRGEIGAACKYSSDCRSGLGCDPQGHCANLVLGTAGSPCDASTNLRCATGLYCSPSAKGVCTAAKKRGEACATGDRCEQFTACRGGFCALDDPSICR